VRLTNGIDPISFRADGVASVFSRHCAGCHGFATSYEGVRGKAQKALGRMTSGSMPPGGGVPPEEIALVRLWIGKGMRP
jgi:mono/diheme cytochrome c family protein